MFSFWVILVAGFAVKVGTSQPRNGCVASTYKQKYSSILVTWPNGGVSQGHRQYLVEYWPLFSEKKAINATVLNANKYLATGLGPSTFYHFNVRDSTSKLICTVTFKTNAERMIKGALATKYINSTTVFAKWRQFKRPGTEITYTAFIEWRLSNKQYAYMVYNGTKNYAWVVKDYIPRNFSFHVNVMVNRLQKYTKNYTWVVKDDIPTNFSIHVNDGEVDQLPEYHDGGISTDVCGSISVLSGDATWPVTKMGQKALLPCPQDSLGNITRNCKKGKKLSEWDEPDYSRCVSKDIASIHDNLQRMDSDPVSSAKQLAQVTTASRHKYSGDIKLIVSSLYILSSEETIQQVKQARSYTQLEANELAMSVLNISNGILDDKVLPLWNQLPTTSAASMAHKVIQSLDNMAILLATSHGNRDVNARTDNVAISVKAIQSDKADVDQRLSPAYDMREEYGSSVYFPGSVLNSQTVTQDGIRYLSVVTYKTINKLLQIQPRLGLTGKVQAPVVSVTLNPLTKNKFDKPVVLTIARSRGSAETGEPTCAFLNISNSSSISWSSEGCEVGSHNDTHTQCLCYHLTSFAVLMQVTDPDNEAIEKEHRFALSVISYVGLCTSILALLVVFLTFTLIRFLNLPRHLIHANLALSLALAHALFLFGIDKTASKVACKVLAISLHYLFLVAFSWMALEGVILYLMLVKVFRTSLSTNKTKMIFIVCGWGIPAVIVGISSAVYHDGYGTEKFCWLSLDRQFIWAFVAPVLAIITFNFAILGFTFYIMAKNGNRSSPKKKVEKFRYWVRSCCLLTCILGVTWLLGVFFVNKQTLFMAYLFSFLNGFQGLMIFLLHCLGDRKIRAVYVNILHCHTATYGISGTSGGVQKDSSTQQKTSPEKQLMKQRTVSLLLRSPEVLQHIEQVKQSMENKQLATTRHFERPRSDPELQEESPVKSSTPLLKTRCKHSEPKSV